MTSNKIRQEPAVTASRRSSPSRNMPVDTLRGVACLLLVTFHVIGYNSTDGLTVPDDSVFRYYTDSVDYLRMPLFTLLAGLVYAWRPLTSTAGYPSFMAKKARRLLVPYVIFVPLIGLTQYYVTDTNSSRELDPLNWLLFSLSPYWFLLTTFWFFAVVALLDSRKLLATRLNFGVLFVASLAVAVLFHTESFRFLQVGQALTLAPFFLAGVAMTRFSLIPTRLPAQVTATVLLLLAVVAVQLSLNGDLSALGVDGPFDSRHSLVGIAVGILFPLVFLGWKLANRQLAWIGGYSSGIFLLHSFAIGGFRAVLTALGVSSTPVLFVLLSVGGVGLSILGIVVLQKFRVGKVVLGEKVSRK